MYTPAQTPRAHRERQGITEALLRLAGGIEHAEDLVVDLNDTLS